MGTIQHKTLVVTSWKADLLSAAHKEAKTLFPPELVSELSGQAVNGWRSFFIAPCGSKLGWDESNRHEQSMNHFLHYIRSKAYDDGSTSLQYAYVSFGELGSQLESSEDRNNEDEDDSSFGALDDDSR